MTHKLLTVREAAEQIGIPYSTARARCNEHNIGEFFGPARMLDAASVKKLKSIKSGKPGRPKEPK